MNSIAQVLRFGLVNDILNHQLYMLKCSSMVWCIISWMISVFKCSSTVWYVIFWMISCAQELKLGLVYDFLANQLSSSALGTWYLRWSAVFKFSLAHVILNDQLCSSLVWYFVSLLPSGRAPQMIAICTVRPVQCTHMTAYTVPSSTLLCTSMAVNLDSSDQYSQSASDLPWAARWTQ
jgi:hypothetical protein